MLVWEEKGYLYLVGFRNLRIFFACGHGEVGDFSLWVGKVRGGGVVGRLLFLTF